MNKLITFIFFTISILACSSNSHKVIAPNAATVRENNLNNAFDRATAAQECTDTPGCKNK